MRPTFTLPVVLLALVAACKPTPPAQYAERMPEADTLPYRACTTADDCVHVNNGCCDCANGGQDIAVAKTQQAAFEARFQCSPSQCTEAGGKCGRGEVTCEAQVCRFRSGEYVH